MHSCVYLDLTLLCNLAYEIKLSIIFFKLLNSVIMYSLILFYSIVASSNDSNNDLFNILLNFFVFIIFQFCLKQYINFVYILRFNIVLINK